MSGSSLITSVTRFAEAALCVSITKIIESIISACNIDITYVKSDVSSPVVSVPPTMKWAPHHDRAIIQPYTTMFITGWFSAIKLSARTYNIYRPSAARANFSFSNFSRTNAFTTRMPATFSPTLSFSASYFSNTCWNSFDTREMICHSDTPSTTIATMKISDSRGSITRHITTLSTSRNGARTVTRSICWNACCRFCTSVVMRVTSPAVEYLSMSLNANR